MEREGVEIISRMRTLLSRILNIIGLDFEKDNMNLPVDVPINPSLDSPTSPSSIISDRASDDIETRLSSYIFPNINDEPINFLKDYWEQMLAAFSQPEQQKDFWEIMLADFEPLKLHKDYWEQMLTALQRLKLDDDSWLKPIKEATCHAECILLQILDPGIQAYDMVTLKETQQPSNMLDEVLDKLIDISHSSEKLKQLFQPFVEVKTTEIVEEEFGIFQRLMINGSDLEDVLTTLKRKTSNMTKINAMDVRLDILLQKFNEVKKDWLQSQDHATADVIGKMAESIYNCKNGIGLLYMETSQITMFELDDKITVPQDTGHPRYYMHVIDGLIYLARQLAVDLANIKCSRNCRFDNHFSRHLVTISEKDKEVAPVWDTTTTTVPMSNTFKNYCHENNSLIGLQSYLKNTNVLQESYKQWKDLEREKYTTYAVTKENCSDISWLNKPGNALDVVCQWDPFFPISCIGHALVSELIVFHTELANSFSSPQKYAKAVLQYANSHLKDLFYCLMNANAAFRNAGFTESHSYFRHPSSHFHVSDSSSSEERSSSSQGTRSSINPVDTLAPIFSQQRTTCIKPKQKDEEESDETTFSHFSEAISNLKQLVDMLVHKNCGHVLRKAFEEAFKSATEQKLQRLGFHQEAREEKLKKLGSTEESDLKDWSGDWEKAFKAALCELLPWPKFLFDEIFSGNTKLKEVSFHEYAKLCLMPLIEFTDTACSAMSNRTESISHQLHVHKVIRELIPYISDLFSGVELQESEPRSFVAEVEIVLTRQEKAILKALADFKSQIQDDKSCVQQNEVDIHKLTCSTVSYVKKLNRHSKTINSILNEYSKSSFCSTQCQSYNRDASINASDCRQFMSLLFHTLETKLSEKCPLHKNSVAAQVFWINNLDYIVEEVELKNILGDEWVQSQNEKIQDYLKIYEDSVRAEVVSCSTRATYAIEWKHFFYDDKVETKLNCCISSINESCKAWALLKIPNPTRRDALRDAAWEVVHSVYRDFWYKLHPGIHENGIVVIPIEKELAGLKFNIFDMFEG